MGGRAEREEEGRKGGKGELGIASFAVRVEVDDELNYHFA